jgi:hypothetical protein
VSRARLQDGERHVGIALGIAILVAPLLFAWFTLRPGHSYWARRFSLGYAALTLLTIVGVGIVLFSMRGYMAEGQADFDEFRIERQIESEAAARRSRDPNGPDAMRRAGPSGTRP